jgi:hypothetical protein
MVAEPAIVSERKSRVQVTRTGIEMTKLGLLAIARKRLRRFGRSQLSGIAEIFGSMKLPRFDIIYFSQ